MTTSSTDTSDLLFGTAPDYATMPRPQADLAMRRRTTYPMQSPVLVCTECGRGIAGAGHTCPHCTRPRRTTLQNAQMLFVTLFAVAFLAKVFVLFLS